MEENFQTQAVLSVLRAHQALGMSDRLLPESSSLLGKTRDQGALSLVTVYLAPTAARALRVAMRAWGVCPCFPERKIDRAAVGDKTRSGVPTPPSLLSQAPLPLHRLHCLCRSVSDIARVSGVGDGAICQNQM